MVLCLILWIILFPMIERAPAPQESLQTARHGGLASAAQLAAEPQVASALTWFGEHGAWITDQQARITAIPAPTFQEADRAAALKGLLEAAGLPVHLDGAGNVIGELGGTREDALVVLAAHLDTVFPLGTDVHVRHDGNRLLAPGISDNGAGLAGLVAVASAMQAARIKPERTILFVADVGEEGEGNLAGIRAVVDAYRRLYCVIALDGAATDFVATRALSSHRLEVVIRGPGGHSWADFGVPNPVLAASRALVRFDSYRTPESPRTTFNVGRIEGGNSINSIPHEVSVKIDLRSEDAAEIAKMETALREAVAASVKEEMAVARDLSKGGLEWKIRSLGERPGGSLSEDSPLLAALRSADAYLGKQSRLERASTDANVPLALGIDAIALGAGGSGGGAHSLREWYDPAGRELGLQRVLLTLLAVSGVAPAQ
jgi:acetylornithine deacetylase/succinyl-diaminopimelate desuccinylase-like protein